MAIFIKRMLATISIPVLVCYNFFLLYLYLTDKHEVDAQLPNATFFNRSELQEDVLLFISESEGNGCPENTVDRENTVERENSTIDPILGLYDSSRTYKIHPFAVVGEEWKSLNSSWHVCLSTQVTVNLLFWVKNQAEMWKGPLSVSVFTPDTDYAIALTMIEYLQSCFPEVRERVCFHMGYPAHLPPRYVSTDEANVTYDCEDPESVNKMLVQQLRSLSLSNYLKNTPYPQNLMRNLARQSCPNEYTFTPDVDMIPVQGMSEQLNEFTTRNATKTCKKCAFVIPTYEIHNNVTTNPVDKDELKVLLESKLAQRFHIKVYAPNQASSNLDVWEKGNMSTKLEIMYNVTWHKMWEPIYVAKSDVPLFDERFIGYGFVRNSQVLEMNKAGYSWQVLNIAFLCHRGFQTPKIRTDIQKKQILQNSQRFKKFDAELKLRYKTQAPKKET